MKRVYVFVIFLFSLLLIGVNNNVEVKAQGSTSGELSIALNEKLPTSFIVNTTAPDFKNYFVVKLGTTVQEITDSQIDLGGFDIAALGDYTITATVTVDAATVTLAVPVKVIAEDTEGPEIRVVKAFLEPIDGEGGKKLTPWDTSESMVQFKERFFIWDAVEGQIMATDSMFLGIEDVRLNQFGEVFSIWIEAQDSKGNLGVYGEINLLVINTIGSVQIEVNKDLPVEVVVNTEEPDFTKYFKITDNIYEIEVTDEIIRRGGFDITKVGTYTVSVIYQREYVFDRVRDIKREQIVFKVIEADVTPPEITTYRIVDELNINGQLEWPYQYYGELMDGRNGEDVANASLETFMQRFRAKDNVDGVIETTKAVDNTDQVVAIRDFFKGIENVRLDQKDTEFIIVFEVTDKAGNTSSLEIKLLVVDDVAPIYIDYGNKYYRINNNVKLVGMLNTIKLEDNYHSYNGDSESVLKIVLNHKDLFEQVQLSYHDLEKYKDRFTEEELAEAAKAYNYMLKNGTHTVKVVAFRSDDESNILVNKEIEIVVENRKVTNLFQIHEDLGLDSKNGLVMYYITNFEDSTNGEFAIMLDAKDDSGNIAPTRTLRVVVENGPTLGTILLVINAGAITIFAAAIGVYFLIKKVRIKKKESEA
ncbi:MAG TPA: hypothetical protein GX003_02130 [Acholeplasmataceae bacterium]|nr:hypothetical protein [Acholeplasmataceae bacterium]